MIQAFEESVRRTRGRVFVSCFTSSTHRVQLALDLAAKHGRKVALLGRSMVENVRTADRSRLFERVAPDTFVRPTDLRSLPRDQVLILVSGSQGRADFRLVSNRGRQPQACFHRARRHRDSFGPGHSRATRGRYPESSLTCIAAAPTSFTPRIAPVHVSGHGSAEELKLMLNLVRPQLLHPHPRRVETARNPCPHRSRVWESPRIGCSLPKTGTSFDSMQTEGRIAGKEQAGRVIVDGSGLGDVRGYRAPRSQTPFRRRHRDSGRGHQYPNGKIRDSPDIITRGFLTGDDTEELLSEARDSGGIHPGKLLVWRKSPIGGSSRKRLAPSSGDSFANEPNGVP